MGSPILTGILFGIEGVCGLLVGGLTSGVQLAISQSNAGGAWDNAKKYVECGKVILATKCPLGQAPEVDAVVAQASHLPMLKPWTTPSASTTGMAKSLRCTSLLLLVTPLVTLSRTPLAL